MTDKIPDWVTNRMPTALTEGEKLLIGMWWAIPGNAALPCPKRVDPARWERMTTTDKLRLSYSEWVHQMILEGKL